MACLIKRELEDGGSKDDEYNQYIWLKIITSNDFDFHLFVVRCYSPCHDSYFYALFR